MAELNGPCHAPSPYALADLGAQRLEALCECGFEEAPDDLNAVALVGFKVEGRLHQGIEKSELVYGFAGVRLF